MMQTESPGIMAIARMTLEPYRGQLPAEVARRLERNLVTALCRVAHDAYETAERLCADRGEAHHREGLAQPARREECDIRENEADILSGLLRIRAVDAGRGCDEAAARHLNGQLPDASPAPRPDR